MRSSLLDVARVCGDDYFVPDRWDRLDQDVHAVERSSVGGDDIHVFSGRAIVMVTSHDCHHDKEFNVALNRFLRAGVDPDVARERAEADDRLDRQFQASPLVPIADFPTASQGNYRAGKVVGYFPVPASPDGAFPESVVDLTYRCTIDRYAITNRQWCLDTAARGRLRYAIARFDSFRSVELSETIEAAVGHTIVGAQVDNASHLAVELELDDGSRLRLVQPPVEPGDPGRTRL